MAYPIYKNKHLEEALFSPKDYIEYKKLLSKKLPKKFILIYDMKLERRIKSRFKLRKLKDVTHLGKIYLLNNVGILRITGTGSPLAVIVLEELIALGVEEFITVGTAGGLYKEGIFLCEKAFRDEGTSYHYIPHGDNSYPDKRLTSKLNTTMAKHGLLFKNAATWTIDAPYRETKKEVQYYKKEGVATVEMEASALFAVASVRDVKIAIAFVVSDILGEKWNPKFHHINLKKDLDKLFEAALDCLSGN